MIFYRFLVLDLLTLINLHARSAISFPRWYGRFVQCIALRRGNIQGIGKTQLCLWYWTEPCLRTYPQINSQRHSEMSLPLSQPCVGSVTHSDLIRRKETRTLPDYNRTKEGERSLSPIFVGREPETHKSLFCAWGPNPCLSKSAFLSPTRICSQVCLSAWANKVQPASKQFDRTNCNCCTFYFFI